MVRLIFLTAKSSAKTGPQGLQLPGEELENSFILRDDFSVLLSYFLHLLFYPTWSTPCHLASLALSPI